MSTTAPSSPQPPSRRVLLHGASDSAMIDDDELAGKICYQPLSASRSPAGKTVDEPNGKLPEIQRFDSDGRRRASTDHELSANIWEENVRGSNRAQNIRSATPTEPGLSTSIIDQLPEQQLKLCASKQCKLSLTTTGFSQMFLALVIAVVSSSS
ncbi:unnamed protein product [Heligmosomoides polygyrus]|uniref:Uncharacterized protein n=1 Tax=Heligmosomoides polygyrus TaxID=6339 RepID=A0A183FJ29_HELPZ|nr:unnamed protein product [Heligmosomoides polygyrus]